MFILFIFIFSLKVYFSLIRGFRTEVVFFFPLLLGFILRSSILRTAVSVDYFVSLSLSYCYYIFAYLFVECFFTFEFM